MVWNYLNQVKSWQTAFNKKGDIRALNTNNEEEKNTIEWGKHNEEAKHNTMTRYDRTKYTETNID